MGTSINLGIALFRINKGPMMARRERDPRSQIVGKCDQGSDSIHGGWISIQLFPELEVSSEQRPYG